jgi:HSP20 family protein
MAEERTIGGATMLMRTNPFRELDLFTQQVSGTAARPPGTPMVARSP